LVDTDDGIVTLDVLLPGAFGPQDLPAPRSGGTDPEGGR
jgi:hypothetical protein